MQRMTKGRVYDMAKAVNQALGYHSIARRIHCYRGNGKYHLDAENLQGKTVRFIRGNMTAREMYEFLKGMKETIVLIEDAEHEKNN